MSLSLTQRAFLLFSAPVCTILVVITITVSAVQRSQTKRVLEGQIRSSDELISRMQATYLDRTHQLTSKLAEQAGFRSAVGLLGEAGADTAQRAEAKATVSAELTDLTKASGFDFFAVTDPQGSVIANVPCGACADQRSTTALPQTAGLTRVNGELYRLQIVPILEDGQPYLSLIFGSRFDMRQLVTSGDSVLLHNGRVLSSTLRPALNTLLEASLAEHCAATSMCSGTLDDDGLVYSEMQAGRLGPGYRLMAVQSLNSLTHEADTALYRAVLLISLGGICLSLLGTWMTSQFVARPLHGFVTELALSQSGGMAAHVDVKHAIQELVCLSNAYNHVVDAERKARVQLETALDAAQVANRLKDEFLTNISHELRTPLNGILGTSELLLSTTTDTDELELIGLSRTSALSLLSLVDNLLDFSHLQTGDLVVSPEPFAPESVFHASAVAISSEAEAKGLRVIVNDNRTWRGNLIGDRKKVGQILGILAENAVKFTDAGFVRLELCCVVVGSTADLTFSVEDSGIGISAETQKLVFERFTQVDGSLTRKRGGTGLGLALAKQLVALMGGDIGLQSSIGLGSTFWFRLNLPVAPSVSDEADHVANVTRTSA